MIQFNLLPSVKMEYVRARRNKRTTILIAGLAGAVSLAILVVLFVGVQLIQKKYSEDLSKDIKTESAKLENTPELNKILTIQNQLNSLTSLHDSKPVTTRIYGYLKQLTPAKVSVASLKIDYDLQTMDFTGSADSINTINKFTDTLKFTTFKTADNKEGNAFSAVVLVSFGRDDKGASYQISLKFDPTIFAGSSDVSLIVPPNKITTRSETEKPDENPEALFQPLSNQNGDKQ